MRTLTATFEHLEDAARAVFEIIKRRVVPSTLELMDQATIRVVENHLHAGLPVDAEAILLIEVDGRQTVLDEDVSRMSPALGRIRPGKINEDVTVPRTKIPALIRSITALAQKYNLVIVCFGHAGDGNIHTNIMLDKKNVDERTRAEKAVAELFRIVLDLGGTLSGEHGIGIAKSPFFQWEVGPEGLETMLTIKKALDPNNILNPGKMFVPNPAFFRQ